MVLSRCLLTKLDCAKVNATVDMARLGFLCNVMYRSMIDLFFLVYIDLFHDVDVCSSLHIRLNLVHRRHLVQFDPKEL